MTSKYQLYSKEKSVLKPTEKDILGPFYRPGSFYRTKLIDRPTLILSGVIEDTEGKLITNAYVDFWQADETGKYDEEGPNFRGIQQAVNGNYILETIKPGYYDISDPGDPQPHQFRCSHIHAKIWINGIDVLTTQLYFADSEYDDTDHWFNRDRCVKFVDNIRAIFDFVIQLPK